MINYVINYSIYESSGGCFKYAGKPSKAPTQAIYDRKEREAFLEKWDSLLKNEMYYDDIKTYYVNYDTMEMIELTDKMDELKKSI